MKRRNNKYLNDKKILKLYKEFNDLTFSKKHYTLKKLDKPIRDGWEKSYVLRSDLDPTKIPILQKILNVINTKIYSKNKDFKYKPHKSKVKKDIPHELKSLSSEEFHKLFTTQSEKKYFSLTPIYNTYDKKFYNQYVFHGKYLLETKIKPSFITHVKIPDPEIERRLAELEKQVGYHTDEWHRICKLKGGHGYNGIDERQTKLERFIRGEINEEQQ